MRPHGARAGSQSPGMLDEGMLGREGAVTGDKPILTEQRVLEQVNDTNYEYTQTDASTQMITLVFQNINGLPVQPQHPRNKNIKD